MKKWMKLLALALALTLLWGCGFPWIPWERKLVDYEDMTYQRPELEEFRTSLDTCMTLAEEGGKFRDLESALNEFLTLYSQFYTQYALANLKYSHDTSDIYWTGEYEYCMELTAEVDAGLDQLYYCLADSVFREELEGEDYFGPGFFDDYEGDSLWDETFTALKEEEAALINRYNELSAQLTEKNLTALQKALSGLYVELIQKRQEMAAYAGYEDYAHFAFEYIHQRDYTPEQAAAYESAVKETLVPVLAQVLENGITGAYFYECTEEENLEHLRSVAKEMGGTVEEAFEWMEKAGLYDIWAGENKYDASFTTFLPDYYVSFVFVDPELTSYDKLTLIHEFGHFCNDFASYGSTASVDVAEVFSQGLEYLSLCGDYGGELEKLSLFSSLCVQVEQTALASFERRVCALEGEALTEEAVDGLFMEVMEEFGLEGWGMGPKYYTLIPHFYITSLYVFSYVVSNDAAMQLYELERESPGAGRQVYLDNLDTTAGGFLEFTEEAGLESPFAEGRLERLGEIYLEVLQ